MSQDNEDLSSVDWANLSPEDFARMLLEAVEEEDQDFEEL